MRMGPFSNRQISDYLNGFYVPVYVSNEDYRAGKFGTGNLKLLEQVWQQASEKKLPHGTVHAWLLAPDGELKTSMHVMHAMKESVLQRMLTETVRDLKIKPGNTLFRPQSQLKWPEVSEEQLILHASSQYSDRDGPTGDDTIVLDRNEWQEFLPPKASDVTVRQEWRIGEELAQKILVHIYPYAPDWDTNPEQIAQCELTAYILPAKDGQSGPQVIVRGFIRQQHNSQPGRDPLVVVAEIAGLVTPSSVVGGKPKILLTTGNAIYGARAFSSLIRSVDLPRQKKQTI